MKNTQISFCCNFCSNLQTQIINMLVKLRHNGKYLGHSFGSNRSKNLLRFEMYEIIESRSKIGMKQSFCSPKPQGTFNQFTAYYVLFCFPWPIRFSSHTRVIQFPSVEPSCNFKTLCRSFDHLPRRLKEGVADRHPLL